MRGVEKNWVIEKRENKEKNAEIEEKIPSYSVIRQWLAKIESLFGKYKSFSQKSPIKEIRRMILTIPISTLEITREVIKKALSTVKNVDIKDWESRTFGQSTLSKRKIAFNS